MTFKRGDFAVYGVVQVLVHAVARDGAWVQIKAEGWRRGRQVAPEELTPWVEPPVIREVDSCAWGAAKPLCWHCRFATSIDCPLFQGNDIVVGMQGIVTQAVTTMVCGSRTYRVTGCRRYDPGPPPPLRPTVVTLALKRLASTAAAE